MSLELASNKCSLYSLPSPFLTLHFSPKGKTRPSGTFITRKLHLMSFFLLSHSLVLKVNCVHWVWNSRAINIRVSTLRRCGWAWCARTTNQTHRAG